MILNSTCWPSINVLRPEPTIALKCANTSGPELCSIKPKPFDSLNHLTVPVVVLDMIDILYVINVNAFVRHELSGKYKLRFRNYRTKNYK